MASPFGKQRTDYKSRLDIIRNPENNHMSRTRTRIDRFIKKDNAAVETTMTGKRKKKGYDGAYVAEVRRQVQSGFSVSGTLLQHLHAFVIDMDLTSLYPSIMMLMNLSPKTFVGKLMFLKKIEIPMYPHIQFIDNEEKNDYKCNSNDFFLEAYTGKHYWAVMEIFCKVPSMDEILTYVDQHYHDFE